MGNIIKIKRSGVAGAATPASLAEGELAYSENSQSLFIGTNAGADIQTIGGKVFTDKLAGIEAGAQVNVGTNIAQSTRTATTVLVTSSTGDDATLAIATTSLAGMMSGDDKTKLDGIEAGADITDAANVNAAGAVMNSDSTTAAMSFVIDEDNMSSNSATKVPTQQSVKSYVDGVVASGVVYKGGYNASTNSPDLDSSPIATAIGDMYSVTAAGTFFTEAVEVGDVLIAEVVNATTLADWTIVQTNLNAGSIATLYESNSDTNKYTNAEKTKVGYLTVGAPVDLGALVTAVGLNTAKVSNVSTNLSVGTVTATNVPINSSDGTDISTLPAATSALAGIVINGAQSFGGTKTFQDISGADAGAVLDSFVVDGGSF